MAYVWNSEQVLAKIDFFSFIFISWSLITLQYCSGFCHTTDFFLLVAGLNSWSDGVENHRLKTYAFICLKRSNLFLQFQIVKLT